MPYGKKVNMANAKIDFDTVYRSFIQPAIEKAGLVASKTNVANSGELLLKNMYARILICRFATADITFDNPNVYYELGISHATRPHTTILLHENSLDKIPLDLSVFSVLNYEYDLGKKVIKGSGPEDWWIVRYAGKLYKRERTWKWQSHSPAFSKYNFLEINEDILNERNFKHILQK